jgi:DNA-binding SARP family transcriptional activator/O-acetyl-ADP-ribose deacetylase (regulator of RNase III)
LPLPKYCRQTRDNEARPNGAGLPVACRPLRRALRVRIMYCRVLGSVDVITDDGRVLRPGRRHERCVLGILLIDANRVVTVERLIRLLWDGGLPVDPSRNVRTYVARLRSLLTQAGAERHGVALASAPGGYRLTVPPQLVDLLLFQDLARRAMATADLVVRERLLVEALDLWQGPDLLAGLDELRTLALEFLMETRLDLGHHRALLPELSRLTAEYPDRERLVELYMLALYRSGRTADALEVFTRARAYLVEQFGVDPGPALTDLHTAILRCETPAPAADASSGGAERSDSRATQDGENGMAAANISAGTRPSTTAERAPWPLAATRTMLFRVGGEPPARSSDEVPRHLGIVTGPIEHVRFADVWVNSENTDLQMSRFTEFSISAIIRYYGARRDPAGSVLEDLIADELSRAVQHTPVAPGTAVVTGAGFLAAANNVRHVVHVAAVQGEPGAGFRPVRDLGRCVRNGLTAAEALATTDERVRSVIFPLLGTGVGGGPPARIAPVMVAAALDHFAGLPDAVLRTVWFLAYDRTERAALLTALTARPELTRADAQL